MAIKGSGEKQSTDTRIRRHQISLEIAGKGVILFGLWTLVRSVLTVTLAGDTIPELLGGGKELSAVPRSALYLGYLLIAVFDVLLRLFVGLSGISEAKGKKVRYVYLVVAVLMVISALMDFRLRIIAFQWKQAFSVSTIVQWIVDITSIITTIHLIVSGIALKKLKKERG